jgi:hypothetical protein
MERTSDPASLLSYTQSEQVLLKVKRSALPLLIPALVWFRWDAHGRKVSSVAEDKNLTTHKPLRRHQDNVSSSFQDGEALLLVFSQIAATRHGATKVAPRLPSFVSILEDTSCETLQPPSNNNMDPCLSIPLLPASAYDEVPT